MDLKFKTALIIAASALLISPVSESDHTIHFGMVPPKNLNNAGTASVPGGKTGYIISDLSYQSKSSPMTTDLVLSFNYPPGKVRSDDNKRYKIRYADYVYSQESGSLGGGCAKFFKKDQRVEIEPARNLWLGSCGDLGSFTLEFRFKIHSLRDNSEIFSRIGYLTEKKSGIEIRVKKSRLHVMLLGMFEKPDGSKIDANLNRGTILKPGIWYHFMLSFDRITGKLSRYINREEDEVVYMTETGKPYNDVLVPAFGSKNKEGEYSCIDAPAAYIGRNFSGNIDEFRISYKKMEDLVKDTDIADKGYKNLEMIERIPVNIEGIVTSPVYTFPSTGTKIISFAWNEILPKSTYIWMELRIYDQLFYENDTDYKWYIIKNNQKNIYLKKDEKGEYIRGKYYQWRAHLIASPDGKNSPVLYDVNIIHKPDLPPAPPMFLEVSAVGDRFVELTWKKNVDADIYGYRVYYGVLPGKFDGILSYEKGRRISNDLGNGNYIKIRIDDSVIDENKALDRRNLLTYPFMRNNILYYFSVSSYDSYKPDTQFNHESDPSKSVTARPFSKSEID